MCGRFVVEIEEQQLREIIEEAQDGISRDSEQLSFTFKGGEIFPGNTVPVITANKKACFMTWGFPSIVADRRPHINARSETAATSKTFGEAIATRRCIVPASAYFEWKDLGKKKKAKYEFRLKDRSPLYMAGIYSEDGEFAILTRDAAPAMTEVHDRMPVIIPKSSIDTWLNESPEAMSQALTELQFEPVPAAVKDKQPEQLRLFD
jgi:putative SOS response-associated peptidase YedK